MKGSIAVGVLSENGRTTKELSVGGENKNIDVLMREGLSGETKVDRYLQRIVDGNARIVAYCEGLKKLKEEKDFSHHRNNLYNDTKGFCQILKDCTDVRRNSNFEEEN